LRPAKPAYSRKFPQGWPPVMLRTHSAAIRLPGPICSAFVPARRRRPGSSRGHPAPRSIAASIRRGIELARTASGASVATSRVDRGPQTATRVQRCRIALPLPRQQRGSLGQNESAWPDWRE